MLLWVFKQLYLKVGQKEERAPKHLQKPLVDIVENKATQYKALYDWEDPVKEKIEKIAKEIYGADKVVYDNKALLNLKRIDRLGFNDFAICMAKTQKSFSDNDTLIGRPKGFTVTVREIENSRGCSVFDSYFRENDAHAWPSCCSCI